MIHIETLCWICAVVVSLLSLYYTVISALSWRQWEEDEDSASMFAAACVHGVFLACLFGWLVHFGVIVGVKPL